MRIELDNCFFYFEDVLTDISIVDSFVCKDHKIGTGHGERKLYLNKNKDEIDSFFDIFSANIDAVILKDNLLKYLSDMKNEYYNPSQHYSNKDNMRKEHKMLLKEISNLPKVIHVPLKYSDVSHHGIYLNQNSGKRVDKYWNLISDIALPKITHLDIIRLSNDYQKVFYFKLSKKYSDLLDDAKDKKVIEKIKNSKLKPTDKETVILARIGQGKYRDKLLKETSICPFTGIDDKTLLVASHIKPWRDSTNIEKIDSKNGFIFSPTYDKLFDKGYISFDDDKKLLISPFLSSHNKNILGLKEGMLIEGLPNIDKKRKSYLCYHRKNVFRKLEEFYSD